MKYIWKYSKDSKHIEEFDNDVYVRSQDIITQPFDEARFFKRTKEVLEIVKNYNENKIKNVLDVGCRDGNNLKVFSKMGFTAMGVDISPTCVKYAQEQKRNVVLGDAHNLSNVVKHDFDAVTLIHSLEHCHNPVQVLKECSKVLVHNGIIGIRVPIQNTLRDQKTKKDKHGDNLPVHYSVFDKDVIMSYLNKAGFSDIITYSMGKDLLAFGKKN